MNIEILDPTQIPDWDARIASLRGATFFHTRAWAEVLSQSYGYAPRYFVLSDSGKLKALYPMMEVSSFLTGRRGVSLPFTDYCEPLVPHNEVFQVFCDAIKQEGKRRGWRYVEFRSGSELLQDKPPSAFFYRHVLDLSGGADQAFLGFRDSTRRNIRKAGKGPLEVRVENTLDAMKDFYRLNCLTRREHGLPPQPWHFFETVYSRVIARQSGHVVVAYNGREAVAANVYFHFGDRAVYKYGASDKAHQNLRASNLVMWEAIRLYAARSVKSLCFGRTEPGNEGLRQFKAGWGADESIINYYRYGLAAGAFVLGPKAVSARANHVFSLMPIPALRAIGGLLYRHMG
jgi:hypothetical protein